MSDQKKEREAITTAVRILCERKWGAARGAVMEDYPEIAKIIDEAFDKVLSTETVNELSPLYYEVHISIDNKGFNLGEMADLRLVPESLVAILRRHRLKCSQIVGQEPDSILTGRKRDINQAAGLMSNAIADLKQAGYVITRWKIEAALIDSKIPFDVSV